MDGRLHGGNGTKIDPSVGERLFKKVFLGNDGRSKGCWGGAGREDAIENYACTANKECTKCWKVARQALKVFKVRNKVGWMGNGSWGVVGECLEVVGDYHANKVQARLFAQQCGIAGTKEWESIRRKERVERILVREERAKTRGNLRQHWEGGGLEKKAKTSMHGTRAKGLSFFGILKRDQGAGGWI